MALAVDRRVEVFCGGARGSTHVVLDVSGFYVSPTHPVWRLEHTGSMARCPYHCFVRLIHHV